MTLKSAVWMFFFIFSVVIAREDSKMMTVPVTSFSCKGRDIGFYADISTNCKVYHTCDDHGNKFTYQCPEQTSFRQEALVCDHTYLVDCQKSAQLISQAREVNVTPKIDAKNDSSYFRSFSIATKPSIILLAPREGSKEPTTFSMSSTVFLRDQMNFRKGEEFLPSSRNPENYRVLSKTYSTSSTTTFRPQLFNQKFTDSPRNLAGLSEAKNLSGQKMGIIKPTLYRNERYPYSKTIKLIENKTEEAYRSPTSRPTTAGTEFPILSLVGGLSGTNNPPEDPYYPRNPTTTEVYYSPMTRSKLHQPFTSNNRKPWLSNVNLKIPEVLPELNSLADIVDRRKHLFISKSKNY